tara:strand:- start:453 stop:590 length:138 start_codon:yes stop_codon:yes gene_type:complete
MNKKINESIKFLLLEYKRLKKKKQERTITDTEKEILLKLTKFLGK